MKTRQYETVGVIHLDGDAAVNAWLKEHSAVADELVAANA